MDTQKEYYEERENLKNFEDHYDPETGDYLAKVEGKIMHFESEEAAFYYAHRNDPEDEF